MDPNQQPPQYPPQFFYPVPGAENQQMYPPQGVHQPIMQPGVVPPQYVMPHPQPVMMAPQTTGYVVSPQPVMAVSHTPMGPTVVPATIPQSASYVTPFPDNVTLLESPTTTFTDRSIKERLFDVRIKSMHGAS